MSTELKLGDISVDVVLKDIKNIHLSVHPPTGRVRIAAPAHMKMETIRVYAVSRIGWIRKHQQKLREQERETPREYLNRESHYVWGQRYLLKVVERDEKPAVELDHQRLTLYARPGTDTTGREDVMARWYREQIRRVAPKLIAKWEPVLDVAVSRYHVQRMKTKWGSCSPASRSIRLNTELAKKPKDCLEYIVVHEMVHLKEPTHNARFVALMDRHLPNWKHLRQKLNRLPVRHADWVY